MALRVVLEGAPKKAFASALDWPGWARAGKTEDEALERLLEYAPRYAAVARRAKVSFDPSTTLGGIHIVERLEGGVTTEFGAPGAPAVAEGGPLSPTELERLVALLEGAWATFDAVSRAAIGTELTLGPRGGGRDLGKIVGHVHAAEIAYLRQLGSRAPASADETPDRPMALLRATFIETLRAVASGAALADPRPTRTPWSPRYAIRRSAWHTLDHAWEIEDRTGSAR